MKQNRIYQSLLGGAAALALSACSDLALDQGKLVQDGPVQRMHVTSPDFNKSKGFVCGDTNYAHSKSSGGYRIGSGDNLRFNIFNETGLEDIEARVDDAGYIQLPILELVHVAGMTTRELQIELKQRFSDHFVDHWVTVELIEPKSEPVYFLGEFRTPGPVYLSRETDLVEGLALVGGLEADAYLPGARLLRNNQICTVDIYGLLKAGKFDQNIQLRGQDVIYAPSRDDMSVYVLGNVAGGRAVPFGVNGLTAMEAITVAGGFARDRVNTKEIRIIRTESPTEGELILINGREILAGEMLDFPLEPGDVVYVPEHPMDNWNAALTAILPTLQMIDGIVTPITLVRSLTQAQ